MTLRTPRPTRLEILEYALEGAQTLRGVYVPAEGFEEDLSTYEAHIAWLKAEIARVHQKDQQ